MRRSRRRKKPSYVWPLGLLTLFLVVVIFIFVKNSREFSIVSAKYVSSIPSSIPLTPTLTLTPTPTLVPTSTPVPLVGYCLHVPILFYHHIQPTTQAIQKHQQNLSVDNGMFDLQMGYLQSKGYTFITVKQLVDALRTHSSLPPKSIAITFDDGYRDWYTYAYPIFQKYHITANFMIATGLLEGADYLTWSQLKEMVSSGLIYVTDHTWSHFGVGGGNREKIKSEIETAKQQLESNLGQTIEIFTYPYGTVGNVALQVLQEDGFTGAFTTIPGTTQCDSFLLALHRTRVGNSALSAYGL